MPVQRTWCLFQQAKSCSENKPPPRPAAGTRTLFSLLLGQPMLPPTTHCTTHCCRANATDVTRGTWWPQGTVNGHLAKTLMGQQSYGLCLLPTFKPERGTHPQRCRGQLLKGNDPPPEGQQHKPQPERARAPSQPRYHSPACGSSCPCTSYCQGGRQQGLNQGPGPAGTYQCPLQPPDMKLHP